MYIGIHTYVYVHGGHLDLARSSTYADPVGGELVCICMSLYMCMFNIINMEIYIHIYIYHKFYVCTHICIQCICTQIHIWLWVKIVSGLFCSDPDGLNRGVRLNFVLEPEYASVDPSVIPDGSI